MAESTHAKDDEREKMEVEIVDAMMRKIMMHATIGAISFAALAFVRLETDEREFMAILFLFSLGTFIISFVVDNWMWTVWEAVPQMFLFTMVCRGVSVIRTQMIKCVAQIEALMCADKRVVPLYVIYFLLLGSCGIMIISTIRLGIKQYFRTGK